MLIFMEHGFSMALRLVCQIINAAKRNVIYFGVKGDASSVKGHF